MALIRPIPPAAAAPPRIRLGKVQNRHGATISAAAATLRAQNAISGVASADTASATPATASVMAPMPRALSRASHQRGMMVTQISASTQGMAVIRPTSSPIATPSSLETWAGR